MRFDGSDGVVDRNIKYLFIKKNYGVQGLTLGRCGTFSMGSKMAEESFNLRFAHVFWMRTGMMKFDVPDYPVTIGFFCAIRVMMVSKHLADLIHETRSRIGSNLGGFSMRSTQ